MNDERTKRLIAMGQMAATLAHEIRNPLGSMELFCTLLKKDLVDQPQNLNLAEQIHFGIRMLERIISNCLQFAREVRPRRKICENPAGFLAELVRHTQAHAARYGVRVNYRDSGETAVAADIDLLTQALLNLLLNAIDAAAAEKAGRKGDSTFVPEVTLSSNRTPDAWTFTVQDNGIGIPSSNIPQVFDPFFTTKDGGTGLGLAITHSIITAHDGTIRVESSPHAGTVINVTLPHGNNEYSGG